MAGTVSDADAYYKVYKSLHLLTYKSLPSVDNALKVWHTNQQQKIPVCTVQYPDGKKPKISSSCQNCVDWGNAIESAFYPPPVPPAKPQITWQNVCQSSLGKSHIEAAKAYVLILPKTRGSPGSTQYTRISDFDSANVLMIMARFSEFHGGDQVIYDKIMKVVEMRNSLSHMGLRTNMFIDDQKVKEYFQDLESLVRCLAQLHPQHFTSAQEVIGKFQKIQMEIVTDKMREEINLELRTDMLKLIETVDKVHKEVNDLELRTEISKLKETVDKKVNENSCSFDLTQCQRQLKADYKSTRSGIAFLPGMPKKFSLDEFFVNLNLVEEKERPTEVIRKTLVQYTDLFALENRNRERLSHVLIRGDAGSGKSTLINRLAHQWATGSSTDGADEIQNPLNNFELVFALNIRNMKPDMDLVDCVQNQLLPDMNKESIRNMLISHADNCLFLFDGYDGLKSYQEVLSSKLLHRSFVIVTTRPDKVDQFCQMYSGYVHVQLTGLSEKSRETFISNYFTSDTLEPLTVNAKQREASELIQRIRGTSLDSLSLFPLLLAMICSIFNKFGEIPSRMTALYERAVDVLATQFYAKTSSSAYLSETQRMEIDSVLLSLGSAALHGLLIDDGKLVFSKKDFRNCSEQTNRLIWILQLYGILPSIGYELGALVDSSSLQFLFAVIGLITGFVLHYFASTRDTVDVANKLGLLSKVHNRNQNSKHCEYSFIHKTFQEFTAARYWSSLVTSNRKKFEFYHNRINKDNVKGMQYLLRFSCGMSYDAAEIILQHVVSVCDIDWRIAVTFLYEAERGSLTHSPLHTILSSLKLDIDGEESKELWSILHHYTSHRHGEDEDVKSWLNSIKELAIVVRDVNIEDITRFLSNGVDIMPNLKSLDIKSKLESVIVTSALETSLIHLITRRSHLRHLVIRNGSCYLKMEFLNWEIIFTRKVFTPLIPKLERLSLEKVNICVSEVLDIIINTGKELERQYLASNRNRTVGSTRCSQHSLPMRNFSLCPLDLQMGEDFGTGVFHKLNEALSFMPCLENLWLEISLTALSLRVLMPVLSQMANLQVVDLSYYDIYDSSDTSPDLQHDGPELSEILQNTTNLRELNLAGTYLTDDDIRLLSSNQPSTLKLTEIDLSFNPIVSHGLIHIGSLMRHTPVLRKLNLRSSYNMAGEHIMAEFSSALRFVPFLTHLSMTLGDEESVILLAEGFRHVPRLQLLYLESSMSKMVSVIGAEAIFRNLVYLLDLQELHFPGFSMEESHSSKIVRECMPVLAGQYDRTLKLYHCYLLRHIQEIKEIVSRFGMESI